jgi:GTP-binding protein YchF
MERMPVLSAALVGLPLSGKSTILNLMTGLGAETSAFGSGRVQAQRGVAEVPDPRLAFLAALYRPRKVTPAQIEVVEVPGLVRGSSAGAGFGNRFLADIRGVDAVIHVVRAFTDPAVVHPEGGIDPLRDLETVDLELLMADLEVMERRRERLSSGKRRGSDAAELALVERCIGALSEGRPVSSLGLAEEESRRLAGFTLLTEKPSLIAVNVDEAEFRAGTFAGQAEIEAAARRAGRPVAVLCGALEAEIARLPEAERGEFLADLGATESGIDRLTRAVYRALGLVSFLTAGEDEVRAWTISRDLPARDAAAKIHSDIARGFIRAEVVAYSDLERLGSMAAARDAGRVRLEGKEYAVQDGDVITFRFHV